jgi:hypothetical protein
MKKFFNSFKQSAAYSEGIMKWYVFIIGLWVACFALPNTLQAQWGFSVTPKISGECAAYMSSMPPLPRVTGFPTKAECENARSQVMNIRFSTPVCSFSYSCTACTGNDIAGGIGGTGAGGTVSNDGSVRVSGTSQGSSFYSANTFEAIQDAYDQKKLQNEMLLGKRDIGSVKYGGYDTKFANFTVGRPGSAEGIFNWSKQRRASLNKDMENRRSEAEDGFTAGRPDAMGGFNAGPARPSVAKRYNGQMFQQAPNASEITVYGTLPSATGVISGVSSIGNNQPDEVRRTENLSVLERKKLENDKEKIAEQTTEINTKIKENPEKAKKLIDKLNKSEDPKDKAMAESLQIQFNNAINSQKTNKTNNNNPSETNKTNNKDSKPCGFECQSRENQAKIIELKDMSTALDNVE